MTTNTSQVNGTKSQPPRRGLELTGTDCPYSARDGKARIAQSPTHDEEDYTEYRASGHQGDNQLPGYTT